MSQEFSAWLSEAMEGIDESTIPALPEGYIDWLIDLQERGNQPHGQGGLPGPCLGESAATAMIGPLEEIDQATLDEVLMSTDDALAADECLREWLLSSQQDSAPLDFLDENQPGRPPAIENVNASSIAPRSRGENNMEIDGESDMEENIRALIEHEELLDQERCLKP